MSFKPLFQEFKRQFDFVEFIKNHYEFTFIASKIFISCPFHPEKTPSCSIGPDGFYCYGCNEHGDSIDFLSRTTGLSYREILHGNEFDDYKVADNKQPVKKTRPRRIIYPSMDMINTFNRQLLAKKEKLAYLESRRIDEYTIKEAKLGWGKPLNFRSFYSPRYTIPVFNEDHILVTVRYRIDPDYDNGSEPKYLGHPNTDSCLYNCEILRNTDRAIIVGSEFDAAYLYHQLDLPAVGLPGENVFKEKWADMFVDKTVLIWLDNDIAGKAGALHVFKSLYPIARLVYIYKWSRQFPQKYDVGDYIKDFGPNGLVAELDKYELEPTG